MTQSLDSVHVVLVRPRRALNLGSTARALKNFGIQHLTLVASEIGSWTDAWRMAVQADDVLHAARQVDALDEALGNATWIVGTTNRARPGQRLLTPRQVATEAAERGAPTLLFGDEVHGLGNLELLRCHDVATIPTAPEQSSLNLAQAVLVFAYELFVALGAPGAAPPPVPTGLQAPASDELLQQFERKLQHALATSAWADADRHKSALAELVQPLRRGRPTEAEVRAWLTALGKVVQRKP
ncbi:MAG: rRNA methyltransferase [Planctomycetes bacterium]|nr:rRNA methyltransferase [Planctomycetota bacterium]